jgi:transcriptional regulator of acetoin/glycerol metabolism
VVSAIVQDQGALLKSLLCSTRLRNHHPQIIHRPSRLVQHVVTIAAHQRVMVMRALDRARGNYENAAKLLGISRKGLFLKRRRWGMRRAS